MEQKIYDFLNKLNRVWLGPVIVLVIALGKIFDCEWLTIAAAVLGAVSTFIGQVVENASKKYFENKEIVEITTEEPKG